MPLGPKREDGRASFFKGLARVLLYGFVTAIMTLSLAFVLSSSQNHTAINLLRDVRNSSRAEACVLALPVDGVKGRDVNLVKKCFSDNGITPPETNSP